MKISEDLLVGVVLLFALLYSVMGQAPVAQEQRGKFLNSEKMALLKNPAKGQALVALSNFDHGHKNALRDCILQIDNHNPYTLRYIGVCICAHAEILKMEKSPALKVTCASKAPMPRINPLDQGLNLKDECNLNPHNTWTFCALFRSG